MKVKQMVLAALLSAAALASVVTAAAPASAAAPRTWLRTCEQTNVIEPSSVILSCGDGGIGVKSITWNYWNSTHAWGTGTFYTNTCKPTCSAGHYVYNKVNFYLAGVKFEVNALFYTTLSVKAVGTPPVGGLRSAYGSISRTGGPWVYAESVQH